MSDFSEFGSREHSGWTNAGIIDAYIKHFVPVTDEVGRHLVDKSISKGDSVLDLCCGQGTLTAAITTIAAEVTGLDFSPEMIAMAKTSAPDAQIVQGNAMDMPFDDALFDKVICNYGMMHIPDQPKTLAEIQRVMKPDGIFTMATWAGPPSSPAFLAVFGALKAYADFSAAPPQPDLFAFADQEQAKAMIADQGLELMEHGTVTSEWVLDQPGELFEIFLTATVGAGMLIRSQTKDTIQKISEATKEFVSGKCRDGSKYRVPVVTAVLSARAA